LPGADGEQALVVFTERIWMHTLGIKRADNPFSDLEWHAQQRARLWMGIDRGMLPGYVRDPPRLADCDHLGDERGPLRADPSTPLCFAA
jgi:hypothetical protein